LQHAGSPTTQSTLTSSQAARILQVSARTIRNLVQRGELAAFNAGSGSTRPVLRITATALDDYIAARTVAPRKTSA
jgi:excisionase family DNA binding protein